MMTGEKPIFGVSPSAWRALREDLPAVGMDAYVVTREGYAVCIKPILVTRINREGGYVVYRDRGAHARTFDVERIAEFELVGSTIARAMARCVALLRENLIAAKADEELEQKSG